MSLLLSLNFYVALSFFILSRNRQGPPGWRLWVLREEMHGWRNQSGVVGDVAFIGRRWNIGGGNEVGPRGRGVERFG